MPSGLEARVLDTGETGRREPTPNATADTSSPASPHPLPRSASRPPPSIHLPERASRRRSQIWWCMAWTFALRWASKRTLPTATMRAVLDNATTARILKFFGINLTGIEPQATDVDWIRNAGCGTGLRRAPGVVRPPGGCERADRRHGWADCRAIGTVAMRVAQDQLDATFGALADPIRRAILVRLAGGDATVNELVEPFGRSLPTISKHLKVLERCGLISRARHAQFRPCHLEPGPLDAPVEWIETSRQIWTERFDKPDEHLRDIQSARPTDPSTHAEACSPRWWGPRNSCAPSLLSTAPEF